jgi:hypothetical protein
MDSVRLVLAASASLACAGCTLAAASAAAGEASSPFPDPPGYHRPVTPPDPKIPVRSRRPTSMRSHAPGCRSPRRGSRSG